MRIQRLNPARGAFTLVELLVVLGIMLVLMSLAVVVATSGILDNHRLSAGTDRVSGWLLQARAKAFRDRLPRGIRFVPDAAGYVREAQFIEVPEPYVPNPTQATGGMQLVFSYRQQVDMMGNNIGPLVKEAYILGSSTDLAQAQLEISNGDTLKIASFTSLQRVVALTPVVRTIYWEGVATPFPVLKVDVATPNLLPDLGPFTVQTQTAGLADTDTRNLQYLTMQFSFLRQARPMLGEQPLKFSAGTALQLIAGQTSQESLTSMSLIPAINTGTGTTYDVLFAPTGEVLNNGGLGRVVLWMRNPDFVPASFAARTGSETRAQYEAAGEMALITVYCKTGAVATHPVGMPPVAGTPYQYTKDGIASGL